MNISKSKIKNTGSSLRKSIRSNEPLRDEDLERLQHYRVSHQAALQIVFNHLATISRQLYKGSLTVYRLKRIDTIIRKIVRYPNMDLSKMQDIAGCRTIVGSENQIRKIVQEIKTTPSLEILGVSDYLDEPRETGYKSFHLILKPIDCEQIVEVQLRTRANHHWATLVEITDLIYDVKLKEGEDHPELYKFHKLLSIDKSKLVIDNRIEIIQIERKLNIISRIISVFSTNYYTAVDRWGKALPEEPCQYLIMEIDNNFSPVFHFYQEFDDAEKAYFEKFSLNEPNMVLIHVNDSNFEKIGLAYSNYVLTSHPSIRFFLEILQNTIIEYIELEEYDEAMYLYEYYDELIDEILAIFDMEITSLRTKLNNNLLGSEVISAKYSNTMEEWIENFNDRFSNLKKAHSQFLNAYEKATTLIEYNHEVVIQETSLLRKILNRITKN